MKQNTIHNSLFASTLLLFSMLLIGQGSFSQSPLTESCGHREVLSIQSQTNPYFKQTLEGINNALHTHIKSKQSQSEMKVLPISDSATRVIPVIVHVVRNPSDPVGAISYAQIESQIDALNAGFSMNYPGYNGQSHGPSATDTKIQFCLAQTPAGVSNWSNTAEPGVMHYDDAINASNQLTIASTDDLLALTHPSAAHFPFNNYLNIWVVQSINGLCSGVQAYAVSPIGPQVGITGFTIDGVVIRADAFGDNSTGNAFTLQPHNLYGAGCVTSYAVRNQGKVLVHEVGHYLNLFHTFQNDILSGVSCAGSTPSTCLNEGDFVCDTPPSSLSSTYLCGAPNPNSCGTADLTEDYMYYAQDPCQNTFTQGQTDRMTAYLDLFRPELFTLENQLNTGIRGTTGCIPPQLIAEFTSSGTNCVNVPITLSSIPAPANTATSFSWSSSSGSISTPTAANTDITFSSPGTHIVTLTVNDGSSPISYDLPIAVSACQLNPDYIHNAQWYYGQYAQVNFLSGTPVPTNIARVNQTIFSLEGSYCYSDDNGEIIYYTDGINLWDNTHTQINSTPLFPTAANAINSLTTLLQSTNSVHGLTGIPDPGHPNEYYIFCSPASEDYVSGSREVRWVHVDLNTGTITSAQDLTPTGIHIAECLTIVPHCNGVDYWVISHIHSPYNQFYTNLVTTFGISAATISTPFIAGASLISELKSAPDNNMLVMAGGAGANPDSVDIVTYSFDNLTGVISNEQIYDAPGYMQFSGATFSPDGQQIYSISEVPHKVIQFDVATGTSSIVITSDDSRQLQLGPDDNIYLSKYWFNNILTGRIVNPNTPNNTGGYNATAIDFTGIVPTDINTMASIPNLMDGIQPDEVPADFTFALNSCTIVAFSVDPCWSNYTVTWNFGDGSPSAIGAYVSHTYSLPGTYSVNCTLSPPGLASSMSIQHTVVIPDPSATITGATTVCLDDPNPTTYYVPFSSGSTCNWSVGANGTIVSPNGGGQIDIDWSSGTAGTVTATLINGGCTITDSLAVTIDFCSLDLDSLSNEFDFSIYPNPTSGIVTIQKITPIHQEVTVKLLDMRSKLMLERTIPAGKHELILDIGNYSDGIYLLQFTVNDETYVKRINKHN